MTPVTYTDITPTWVGFSVNPSGVTYRYGGDGKYVHIYLYATTNGTQGGGASTTCTVNLPPGMLAKNTMAFRLAQCNNNGTLQPDAIGILTAGSNTIQFFPTSSGTAWAGAGAKRVAFDVSFEQQ